VVEVRRDWLEDVWWRFVYFRNINTSAHYRY